MKYRIYVLDYRFQILESHDFEGQDDLSALDKGNAMSRDNPVEIWQCDRFVACIGMDGEGAPSQSFMSLARRDLALAA
jgi:hypothetical protein